MPGVAVRYLYYCCYRLVRAHKDSRFGEFRAESVLQIFQVIFVAGCLGLLFRERVLDVNKWFMVAAVWVPVLLANLLWLGSTEARKAYMRDFARLPVRRRRLLDVAAVLFCLGSIALVAGAKLTIR
jgi:hypothetical protein